MKRKGFVSDKIIMTFIYFKRELINRYRKIQVSICLGYKIKCNKSNVWSCPKEINSSSFTNNRLKNYK